MTEGYILGIDQSTQGTKALLFDGKGKRICRTDLAHRQIVNEKGWVEHDPVEIYENTLLAVKNLLGKSGITGDRLTAVGISNQRETALVWDRKTGEPVYNAIVWQCARGAEICRRIEEAGHGQKIREHTGLNLSPYFSAAKLAWILENVPGVRERAERGELCCGTVDSWLVYKLTGGSVFATDPSNASRTQLFNINTLAWDEELCQIFGIPMCCLAEVRDSNGEFGMTDFEGSLPYKIPIHAVLGDSHAALYGQGCLEAGLAKVTYGTGSSVMMNIGSSPILSSRVVTSVGWCMDGKAQYVLEGNINYTGAVITWLKDDMELIQSPGETEPIARIANPEDRTYLVPAFTGLGAPYWDSEAKGLFYGMTRTTKKAELVKAGLESIAYQIQDVVEAMEQEAGLKLKQLRADGGATGNGYLMQFQSDLAQIPIQVSLAEELSGIGAAYAAGIGIGEYDPEKVFGNIERRQFLPDMEEEERDRRYEGWKEAVGKALSVSA